MSIRGIIEHWALYHCPDDMTPEQVREMHKSPSMDPSSFYFHHKKDHEAAFIYYKPNIPHEHSGMK